MELEGFDDLDLGQVPLGDTGVNLAVSLPPGESDHFAMELLGDPPVAERP